MINQFIASDRMLLAGFLAGSILVFSPLLQAQTPRPPAEPHSTVPSPAQSTTLALARPPSVFRTVTSSRAAMMYRKTWGIDDITVKVTASGSMVRFSYRVLDRNRARMLNDKKLNPVLTDETTGTRFEVPVMEKVGQLRQTATPENGRAYWMVFGNKSHIVKPGSHVTVVIGNFRAEGLVVQASSLPHTR